MPAVVAMTEAVSIPLAQSLAADFYSRLRHHGVVDRALVEALANSKVFQEYERAFNEATGLPVALRPVETWQLPHHGKRNEGPFCSLISEKSRACASCLSVQEQLSDLATLEAHTIGCPNGLSDTAVPVRLGDRLKLNVGLRYEYFGRPDANQDPPYERMPDSTIVQALHLMNSPDLHKKFTHDSGRAAKLAASDKQPDQIVEELYLSVYSRFPTDDERQAVTDVFVANANRRAATEDLLWALVNTPEFMFKD